MTTQTLLSGPQVNQIATLLLPVSGRVLVLPNVSVAEIIPYRNPVADEDVPTWFLGHIEWRAQTVPVVSFEAINDEPFAGRDRNRRIAVLNAVAEHPGLPFFGIVTEGLPRLMRVMADELASDGESGAGPAELMRVVVSGESAVIPDLAFIQRRLVGLPSAG